MGHDQSECCEISKIDEGERREEGDARNVVVRVSHGNNKRGVTRVCNSNLRNERPIQPPKSTSPLPSNPPPSHKSTHMALNAIPMTEEERRSVVQGPGDVEWKYVSRTPCACLLKSLTLFVGFRVDMKCVASARRFCLAFCWVHSLHPSPSIRSLGTV
jgi:hypothetical protein